MAQSDLSLLENIAEKLVITDDDRRAARQAIASLRVAHANARETGDETEATLRRRLAVGELLYLEIADTAS